MISEEKFYEKAKDFALLTNTKKEYFTLEEYKEKVKHCKLIKMELLFIYIP